MWLGTSVPRDRSNVRESGVLANKTDSTSSLRLTFVTLFAPLTVISLCQITSRLAVLFHHYNKPYTLYI